MSNFSQPIFCCSRAAQRAALPQRDNDALAPQLAAAHRNDGKRTHAPFSIGGFGSQPLRQVFALHPVPYFHGSFQLEVLGIKSIYEVEQFLIMCMFLRFYTVVRYLREREAVKVTYLQYKSIATEPQ